MLHVLIVDHDVQASQAVFEVCATAGVIANLATSVAEAHACLNRQLPDLVIAEMVLPDGGGREIIHLARGSPARTSFQPVPVIFITCQASIESAVEALRLGALDYLVKPIDAARMLARINAMQGSHQNTNGDAAKDRSAILKADQGQAHFGRMIGASPVMQTLYRHIERVAPTDATVFLLGESGTGKELAAQTIHEVSLRNKAPFLPLNCGAISPHLIESEIFGHEKGSFTGAEKQHKGYFERANGGTLFLDEVTEMPLELQVKLLRVLESGTYMRIGSTQELATNVRIIAASNREPERVIAEGRLRLDLYHRLNVFPIQMPPLRERGADIALLAESILDQLNSAQDRPRQFSEDCLKVLECYDWPGNVRELRNNLQRAFILSDDRIDAAMLTPHRTLAGSADSSLSISVQVGTTLSEVDRQLIFATLKMCGGLKKRAAHLLGISLKTLYNRLEEYGA